MMNLTRLLAKKYHQKPLYIAGIPDLMTADEFHEHPPKSVVAPINIDGKGELTLQDLHVEPAHYRMNIWPLNKFERFRSYIMLYDIVTGDESWIHTYELESK